MERSADESFRGETPVSAAVTAAGAWMLNILTGPGCGRGAGFLFQLPNISQNTPDLLRALDWVCICAVAGGSGINQLRLVSNFCFLERICLWFCLRKLSYKLIFIRYRSALFRNGPSNGLLVLHQRQKRIFPTSMLLPGTCLFVWGCWSFKHDVQ